MSEMNKFRRRIGLVKRVGIGKDRISEKSRFRRKIGLVRRVGLGEG